LIATGIDACFDVGSNVFLYFINKKALKMDVNKWPVGGARLETIGNIIYGEIRTLLVAVACPHHTCLKVPCSFVSLIITCF
jgi:divalent metal cation (Fe/Co/Zn/Cd) transporter